jgi:hypothetical protein
MYFHENKNEIKVKKISIYHKQENLNEWKITEEIQSKIGIKIKKN